MISRFITLTKNSRPVMRAFSGEVATSESTSNGNGEISQYINGNLVKRSALSLKKTEDIQG